MEMFDQVVETRFVSDEETLRDMVKELDLREAQIVFADVTARMVQAQTTDPQLCKESEAANRRLFALFEQGWAKFQSMGKTYRASLPEQDLLFPPSLRDGLPEDHLAYFVSDVGRGFGDPSTARGASAEPGHVRGHSALIQENQLLRRDRADVFQERLAPLPVRLRVALLRVE